MTDPVKEMLEKDRQPAEIMEAADESDFYEEVLDDNHFQAYRSPERLVVSVAGRGLYVEEFGSDSQEFISFIDQHPWDSARETTYELQGFWKEIMRDVEAEIAGEAGKATPEAFQDTGSPAGLRYRPRQTDTLSGAARPGEFSMYRYQGDEGVAVIEFDSNRMRVHEKGDVELPAFEQLEGLRIASVTTGHPGDQEPRETLPENG